MQNEKCRRNGGSETLKDRTAGFPSAIRIVLLGSL
jgi:hypothetical protein